MCASAFCTDLPCGSTTAFFGVMTILAFIVKDARNDATQCAAFSRGRQKKAGHAWRRTETIGPTTSGCVCLFRASWQTAIRPSTPVPQPIQNFVRWVFTVRVQAGCQVYVSREGLTSLGGWR